MKVAVVVAVDSPNPASPYGDTVSSHDSDGLMQAVFRVMERIKSVERTAPQRLMVQEDHGHWTPSGQDNLDAVAVQYQY